MTGVNHIGEQLSCDGAGRLFEKVVVGERLSVEENELLDAHLAGCQTCDNQFRLISVLPLFANSAVESDYASDISNVLEQLHTERNREIIQRVWIGAALAVVALFAAGVVFFRPVDRDESRRMDGASLAVLTCNASTPDELVQGVFLTHCEGEAPGTVIEDGNVRLTMREGAVALQVDPNRHFKKQVSVVTQTGEVRVKGTLFAVHAGGYAGDFVKVYRGVVEVIPEKADRSAFRVNAGYASLLNQGNGVFEMTKPACKVLTQQLEGVPLVPQDAVVDAAPGLHDDLRTDRDVSSADGLNDQDAGPHRRNNRYHHHQDTTAFQARVPMETLISDARECLLVRDWQCAASKYHRVIKLYSHMPESNAVLISLAKIELRHLNRPQAALKHYSSYLQKGPERPLAEEALLGVAKSYRRLGKADEEKGVLTRYIQMYPDSASVASARERLQQLSSNATN